MAVETPEAASPRVTSAVQNKKIVSKVEEALAKRPLVREKLLAREQARARAVSTSVSSGSTAASSSTPSDNDDDDVAAAAAAAFTPSVAPTQEERHDLQNERRPVLAQLCVSELAVRGLTLTAHHEAYLAISLENACKTTQRFPELNANDDGDAFRYGDEAMELDVTDVEADLVIALFSKPTPDPGLPDTCIGKVVVSLSRLYADSSFRKLLSQRGNHYELDAWFEFYPLEASQTRFELAIPGVSGLKRPPASLGQLHVRLDLDVHPGYPLVLCALLNPPFRPRDQIETSEGNSCPKHIKFGELRLRALVASVQVLLETLQSVRNWDRPNVSGFVLAWHIHVCLFAPCWQIPILVALLFVALTIVFPYAAPVEPPLIFDDQTPTSRTEDARKAKAEEESLADLEAMLNTGAFHAERLFNAFNWTDKLVSIAACIAVVHAGLAASLLAFLLRTICTHCLSLHKLAFVAGVLFMCPQITSRLHAKLESSPKPLTAAPSKTPAARRYFSTALQLLANLRARVLDAHELVHRRIAATQELACVEPNGEPQPLVPDLIAPPFRVPDTRTAGLPSRNPPFSIMARSMLMMDVDEGITGTQPLNASQEEDDELESDGVWGRLVHTERSALYQAPPPQSRRPGQPKMEIGAVDVKGDTFKIGRGEFMDLPLKDVSVSLEHCILERQGGTVFISDNQSSNGTYVLGKRLKRQQRKELKNGDVFSLVRSRPSSAVREWYEFCFEKIGSSAQHEDEMNRLRFAQRVAQGDGPRGAVPDALMVSSSGDSGMAAAMQCEEFVENYTLINKLGEGGHASVYRVQGKRTGKSYALKVIDKRQFGHGSGSLKDLTNEALIMRNLKHPGIIELKNIFSTDRALFLIMELVHGGELFDRIVNMGKYPENRARGLVRNILQAVAYLHDLDIVHRDLKPENILMTSPHSDIDIKLADFGLAKEEKKGRRTLCGTVGYAAPEVLRRQQSELGLGTYGKEADMWSLGVTVYIILAGTPPFPEGSTSHDEQFRALRRAAEFRAMSPILQDFILGMLEVDGKKRLTVHQALRHPWLKQEADPPMAPPMAPPETRRLASSSVAPVSSSASQVPTGSQEPCATSDTHGRGVQGPIESHPYPPPHPFHDRSNRPNSGDSTDAAHAKRKVDVAAPYGRPAVKLVKIRSDDSLL
ncbi:Protein kinase, putative [Hondaea fermentalgiana]|uniref:Protein kinase, putative n=1 Tax=Hondaea fermentalgiana TaxID=2315210 RepID=A0A2R5GEX8_9STRA|nr:Protein kinase, putative [Hondaea fermentalgiana]|eukprot:GBG29476.1 Protein kinase, putative [Hondaea fermentalgiana]